MTDKTKMYVAFTVDVDPDINVPIQTRPGAVSYPVEEGKVRFGSVEKGLRLLTGMLDELNIEATFFFEARTAMVLNDKFDLAALMSRHEVGCHSFEHEDFTDTSLGLDRNTKLDIIKNSMNVLRKIFPEHNIQGFRAPYIKIDQELAQVIEELGFKYDSTVSLDWDHDRREQKFKPRNIKGTVHKIIELPLPVWKEKGKRSLTSYLWPYLESDRELNEYWSNITRSAGNSDNELLILATHPWHFVETYKKGCLGDAEIATNFKQIKKLLLDIESLPSTDFIRLDRYLNLIPVDTIDVEI